MHITTLGTSHGDSTYCRFNSSTLYESGGACYLIDCGAPCEALLCRKEKDFSKIRAVFCTHMHNDHVGGLTELVKILLKYARPEQHTTIFFSEAGAKEAFIGWLRAMHLEINDDLISFQVVRPGEIYTDENIAVRAYPTDHIQNAPVKPSTFAYIIAEGDKRLLHTGDLSGDLHDYPKLLMEEHFDLLLCEATHYNPESAVLLFAHSQIDRLILSHIGNCWHGSGEKTLLAYYNSLPYPVVIAHDGDEFTL